MNSGIRVVNLRELDFYLPWASRNSANVDFASLASALLLV